MTHFAVGAVLAAVLMSAGGAQAAVPSGNLILNPGADEATGEIDSNGAPIPHWFTSGNLSAVQYGSSVGGYPTVADGNAIGGGPNFFSGGKNDPDVTSTAFQFIEIPGAASEIDAGRVSFTLSAYLGGKPVDNDTATVTASFEDEHSDHVYGTVQIGPVTAADQGTQTVLLPRSLTADVPAGTRRIRLTLTATKTTGQHNNGYADSLSLTLDLDPTAVNDAATVAANASATAVNVLANDTDTDGGPKTVASVTQPTNGTVAISGGGSGLTYQPNANYCNSQSGGAADTFTYTLNGGSTATVAMTVTCVANLPPSANTGAATQIFPGLATLEGVVNSHGPAATYRFEYGTSAAYGSATPTASTGGDSVEHPVSARLTGLGSSTTYHYRLVATSAAGTTLGADRQFESAALSCGSLAGAAPKPLAGTLTGTANADTIIGTLQNNRIASLGGDDCVLGLSGNDTIDAGAGNDRVDGDGVCPPGPVDATFCTGGGSGNDVVEGGEGRDTINGGGGNDRLSGQAGDDRLRGGSGNDDVSGGSGDDLISGGEGKDSLSGGSGDDRLRGSSGNDRLSPGSGKDSVAAGSGTDRIQARDGQRDRIDCGPGRDTVTVDRLDTVASNCERVSRRR